MIVKYHCGAIKTGVAINSCPPGRDQKDKAMTALNRISILQKMWSQALPCA